MKNLVLIFLSGLFLVGFKSNAQLTSVTNNPVTNITNEELHLMAILIHHLL